MADKPRIRIRPGARFGVVERVRPETGMSVWACACGSNYHLLAADGAIVCSNCSRVFRGEWVGPRRG